MYYGKKVYLRSIELDDVDNIMERFNTLELRKTLGAVLPATREQEIDWIKNTWEGRNKGTKYEFSICLHDGTWIGTGGLFSISNTHRHVELGIAIHAPEHQGKGYGTDAVTTICGFAFRHLNMHSVNLWYLDFNTGGAKAYTKAGFTKTGIARDFIFRDGEYTDAIRMDILDREWFEKFGEEYTLFSPN